MTLKYTIEHYEEIKELLNYLLEPEAHNRVRYDEKYELFVTVYKEVKYWNDTKDLLITDKVFDKSNPYYKKCCSIADELTPQLERVATLKPSCYFISIHGLNGYYNALLADYGGYSRNPFFDALELIKALNDFYNIEPKKAPNRLAFGWEKCREKSYPDKYLASIIRNYLKDNGVFDNNEWLNIIGLKYDLY